MNAVYKWGWFGGANTNCGCDSLYAAYFGTGLLLSYLVRCVAQSPLHVAHSSPAVPVHRLLHPDLQAGCGAPAQGARGRHEEEDAMSGHFRGRAAMGRLVQRQSEPLEPRPLEPSSSPHCLQACVIACNDHCWRCRVCSQATRSIDLGAGG